MDGEIFLAKTDKMSGQEANALVDYITWTKAAILDRPARK